MSTPVDTLAKAMINNTINHPEQSHIEIVENAEIFKLAAENIQ
jgi:hypothetical protein